MYKILHEDDIRESAGAWYYSSDWTGCTEENFDCADCQKRHFEIC